MSKFKVGDKVRVREDLDRFDRNESPGITLDMLHFRGWVYTVKKITISNFYVLGSTGYKWLERWLEPLDNQPHFEGL